MTFTCGSLFTGIGGIDLAFVTAGCDILFQVEIDAYCTKVLEKHHDRYWPHATRFTDVREVGGHNLPRVDILFGGFPCQDLSLAGKRLGISEGTRSGLWFEFARIIGDLRPRVVLLENVPGILTRDGTIVIADLAQMGYVGHWGTLSAADAGAPHQRERWFCVAYRTGDQRHLRLQLGSNGRAHQTKQIGVGYPALVNASSQRASAGTTSFMVNASQCPADIHAGDEIAQKQTVAFATGGRVDRKPVHRGTGVGHTQPSGRSGVTRRRAKSQPANGHTRHGRAAQSRVGRNFTRVSARMDGHRRIDHGTSTKAGTIEILRTLWEAIDPQALQRDFRRLRSIYPPEVLRSAMCRISAAQRRSHSRRLQEARLQAQEGSLSGVQSNGKSSNPSHRWQSEKQPPLKFDDLMRFVSYEMALEQWKNNSEGAINVQSLWRAIKEICSRDVPETLSACEEIWRSLSDQKKAWVAVRYCQGARLTEWPWPARPGQPQFAWEPPRVVSGQPNRTARLKALGNSVVPQCVYPIACEIVTWLEAQAREESEVA